MTHHLPPLNKAPKPARWSFKKGRLRSGRMRLAPTYRLSKGGCEFAILQCFDQFAETDSKWFWYGDGLNTCGTPMDLDECKASALAHFKAKA